MTSRCIASVFRLRGCRCGGVNSEHKFSGQSRVQSLRIGVWTEGQSRSLGLMDVASSPPLKVSLKRSCQYHLRREHQIGNHFKRLSEPPEDLVQYAD